MKKILVLGGCGYVGSVLVPAFLRAGYLVHVLDTLWFGNHLASNANLKVLGLDIREIDKWKPIENYDCIVHLANIANDPGVELCPELSWEVNVLATKYVADFATRNKIDQIIYASSGSVYGLKDEENVTEDLALVPLSTYNKTKMIAERILLSYSDVLKSHIIRPATVCGLSPRMRLDVSVNALTYQGVANGLITVFGGDQIRPNIHIHDLASVFIHFVENPYLDTGAYNAGFQNLSIMQIAEMVAEVVDTKITRIADSNDPRSYRVDSSKLLSTGFAPSLDVGTAINEIVEAYRSGDLRESASCYTVQMMKKMGLAGGN
ncbi:SDR family oxidoreductase [Litorivicinus sp.]|nr:SDR family oxidoreductase [Litorivicinus sp.]